MMVFGFSATKCLNIKSVKDEERRDRSNKIMDENG